MTTGPWPATMPPTIAVQANNGSALETLSDNTVTTPLALQAATKATRTSADLVNTNWRTALLTVIVANRAGAATITPRLDRKNSDGSYVPVWQAAAAIAANGTYLYEFSSSLGNAGTSSMTEHLGLVLPRNHRLVLVYSGNGTTDAIDTLADLEYGL